VPLHDAGQQDYAATKLAEPGIGEYTTTKELRMAIQETLESAKITYGHSSHWAKPVAVGFLASRVQAGAHK
jgi:hypothetical protein